MKDYIEKMKAWWAPLAIREKQAVLLGGSCVTLLILYAGIWSPMLTHINTMRQQIVTEQKTLQFMQIAEKQIAQSQGNTVNSSTVLSPVDFLSYLQKQCDQTGLSPAITQIKQSSDDAVTVKFQKVEFDRLMRLLLTVMKAQRVSVEQMTATSDATPGIANVDLVLKLG